MALRFGVWERFGALGFRFWALGFRVWERFGALGFRVWGFRV